MEPNSSAPLSWALPMRRRRSSSPPLISLPVLIILLPTLSLILLFFAIRLLLSLTNQVFWPNSVKKSWDSFNVFLVLFVIICGINGRRKDDEPTAADVGESCGSGRRMVEVNGDSELSQHGFEFAERRFYDSVMRTPGTATVVTDLRHESPRENGNDGNKFLFFDDFETNKFRSRSFSYRARGCEIEESPAEIKVIPVDSFVANSSPASHRMKSPNPQPPPPPPPPPVTRRKSRQTIEKKEEVREVSTNNAEIAKSQWPPLPPRTVIPPSPIRVRLEEKFRKSERKKTNVKKEIAIALASLYRKRKTKQKARDIYDGDRHSPTDQRPPPPPPPPPPPSFFRIFKKQNKNKEAPSESAPLPPVSSSSRSTKKKNQIPPPPSPPPPPSSRQKNSTASPRPPLPPRVQNSTVENQVINSAVRNPSETIPPPYQTTTDVKSRVRGDTVGSQSSETFYCGSPEPVNVGSSSTNGTSEPAVEVNGVGPVFCPSPDVNIIAANFIARLRGEWRLERMNSVREKEMLGQAQLTN
ncbi:CREB-regulated transcription coactivator 1-like [Cucurbita maxima]|uniref:CREB-regulated transcription coactivator 1-like n=1 Tax=Cucurbita maxima TaxID=3661 RepID=A0A6J1JK59_CUCMA|nr:CREB-regulated transcription coactivator 1-like [Cucurbita maxima]